MQQFRTSKGETITGEQLQAACEKVAQWYEANALAVRNSNSYASHVTEARKDQKLAESYDWAEKVRQGENLHNFSVWQRVNIELTGDCVAFMT